MKQASQTGTLNRHLLDLERRSETPNDHDYRKVGSGKRRCRQMKEATRQITGEARGEGSEVEEEKQKER